MHKFFMIIMLLISISMILIISFLWKKTIDEKKIEVSQTITTIENKKDIINNLPDIKKIVNNNVKIKDVVKSINKIDNISMQTNILKYKEQNITRGSFIHILLNILLNYKIVINSDQLGNVSHIKNIYINEQSSIYYYDINQLYYYNLLLNPNKKITDILGIEFREDANINSEEAKSIISALCVEMPIKEINNDNTYQNMVKSFNDCLSKKYKLN
jgi:hypothetical protein